MDCLMPRQACDRAMGLPVGGRVCGRGNCQIRLDRHTVAGAAIQGNNNKTTKNQTIADVTVAVLLYSSSRRELAMAACAAQKRSGYW